MSSIQSFRDLDVWQAAMELVVLTYGLAGRRPAAERTAELYTLLDAGRSLQFFTPEETAATRTTLTLLACALTGFALGLL